MSSIPLSFAYSYSSAAAYAIAEKHGRKAPAAAAQRVQQREAQGQRDASSTDQRGAQDALKTSLNSLESDVDAYASSHSVLVRARCPTTASATGAASSLLGRCPSFPKSRRSAAIWRPTSKGGRWRRVEVLDARWSPAARARPSWPRAVAGPRGRAARAARQVPGVGALRRRLPAHAPAHDRHAAARPVAAAAAHARADRPRRPRAGLRRPAPLRHRRAGARPGGARRLLRRPARRRAARARLHRRPPLRARADLARADQGVPARPEARRRRREHLRRRGAVPRARAPAAAGQPADPRAVRGDPRRASSSR